MPKYLIRLPNAEPRTIEADGIQVKDGELLLYTQTVDNTWSRRKTTQIVFRAAPGGWLSYELLPEEPQ